MTTVTISQSGRLLALDTPLGKDVLIPTSFSGEEGMSRLFSFSVEAFSANDSIAAADLLGKSVTVTVNSAGHQPRLFNGVVTGFSTGTVTFNGYRRYALTLSPWLWLLDRTSDCRIFQSKSVKDIAAALFGDAGFSDYDYKAQGGTTARDYCVQYNESDFAFLSRLFEEEGIFYFFQHSDGKHQLVLADQSSAYGDSGLEHVTFRPDLPARTPEMLTDWRPAWSFVSGKWTLRDYDFEKPTSDLTGAGSTILGVSAFKSWERFDYPGRYTAKADGDDRAKRRMEADEAGFEMVAGAGTYAAFAPGTKFTLSGHPVAAEQGKAYALVSVQHDAKDNAQVTTASNKVEPPSYGNRFTCLPATTTFRPPPATPRPVMRGPQVATVVGASGDEICCDKYGRIRVQFPWDRLGTNDDKSSCWLRVAQPMAGRKWGTLFIPRVGMEVVVDFLDGDPDRPLVTGTVYNAENMPPWDLPANKTRSGLVTRSSTGGEAANANELRFEDKKGEEQILFHAEKDFLREVENDDTLTVDHDQSITVKNNRTLTVSEGDETITIAQGSQTLAVEAGDRTVTVHGDLATTVSQGNRTLTVSQGNLETTVSSGNHTTTVSTGNLGIKTSAGSITIDAMQGIELKCGSNSIKIDQQGITVKGMQVKVQGEVQVEVKGAMTTLKGDATVTIQGGLVKIN